MTLEEQQAAAQRAVNLAPSLLSFFNEGRNWMVAVVIVPHDAICGVVAYHYASRFREAGHEIDKANVHEIGGPHIIVLLRPLGSYYHGKGMTLSRLYIPFKESWFSKKHIEAWDEWMLTVQCQGVNNFKGFFY